MSQYNNDNNNAANNTGGQAPEHTQPAHYNTPYTYQSRPYSPPPYGQQQRQRKGVSGGVIAAIVAVCLCFSVLTSALGAAAGFYISQNAMQQQLDAMRREIAALPTSAPAAANTESPVQSTSYTPSAANVDLTSVAQVVSQVRDSVVGITVKVPVNMSNGRFGNYQYMQTGGGSGVVISQDGYILTNNHVVSGATEVSVMFEDGSTVDAQIIGTDSKTDLAILKVDKTGLPYATLGSSSVLQVGDAVIAIGNPLGELNGTVTQGIISATERTISFSDGSEQNVLQTDASINSGNSGGALVNMSGEVIGIVVAKSSGVGIEGIGFAIPIDNAKPIIEELINNGYVTQRPKIGVSLAELSTTQELWMYGLQTPGVYIAQVEEGSAAEDAGLKQFDRVVSFDGKDIETAKDVTTIKDTHKVGDTVPMVIERDGSPLTLHITLKEDKPVTEKPM